MPSNHLILSHPFLLLPSIFPSIRIFSSESALCIRWSKYWSFSFNIIPSNEHLGLISFKTDWLDLLAVQGTLKSLIQHHSSKASILRCSGFFLSFLKFIYFNWRLITLQYCIAFVIHWHESATGVHVLPILNSPLTFLPIPSEQVSLKKCPPPPPCVRAEIRHWRPANRRSWNRGNRLGSDRCNRLKPYS